MSISIQRSESRWKRKVAGLLRTDECSLPRCSNIKRVQTAGRMEVRECSLHRQQIVQYYSKCPTPIHTSTNMPAMTMQTRRSLVSLSSRYVVTDRSRTSPMRKRGRLAAGWHSILASHQHGQILTTMVHGIVKCHSIWQEY